MAVKSHWPNLNLIRQLSGYEDPKVTSSEENVLLAAKKEPRIAIIGAGVTGLCAARHAFAKDSRFNGVVFERGSSIGGTWVYTDDTGKDKYGQPIHSPLYHDLVTNLPKEVMEFLDFPFEKDDKSYLTSEEVLNYLNKYAEHYDLLKHIKLKHLVTRVAPVGKTWSVSVLDLETQVEHVSLYDAVMVCSGPTAIPVYPQIEGLARFSGMQLHAKSFRRGVAFSGKRVLVIGLGPSGLDIMYKVLPHAKQVILCHNRPSTGQVTIPSNVIIKPAAASMLENTVTFSDGSSEEVDVVIHCTGYTYNFPFLTKECGLIVDQYVRPLYLHLFNIDNPTMGVLGVPKILPFNYCAEYQALAFLAVLRGDAELPSAEEMLKEVENDKDIRLESGQRKKDLHKMGKMTKEYFESLRKLSKVPPLPDVRYHIFFDAFARALKDFANFRFTKYKIIDDEKFEVEFLERPKEPEPEVPPSTVQEAPEGSEQPTAEVDKLPTAEDTQARTTVVTEQTTSHKETPLVGSNVQICDKVDVHREDDSSEYEVIGTHQEKITETQEQVFESSQRTQVFETSTTTATIKVDSMDELQELLEKLGHSMVETSETSTERVEKVLTKRTVQETVIVDGKESTTVQVEEDVVENCFHEGGSVQKCDNMLNSNQQLSEEIACKKENVKHR